MNPIRIRIDHGPGIFERGCNAVGRGLRSAADATLGMFEQYTPQGAERMAESMDNRDLKAFAAMHGAFWSTVPIAIGLLGQMPTVAMLGGAAMVGCIAYGLYQAVKS